MGCSASGVGQQVVVQPQRVVVAPAAAFAAGRPAPSAEPRRWRPSAGAAGAASAGAGVVTCDAAGHLQDHYFLHDQLGCGCIGTVRRAVKRHSGENVAVKCMNTEAVIDLGVEHELEMMARLNHPNIIQFVEGFEDIKHTYLVMEICGGGELFDKVVEMKYFTEKATAVVMQQMFSAVSYMHRRNICHRDLKPENFLLKTGAAIEHNTLKLIDFGLACTFERGQPMKECVGTVMYMAPEVFKKCYTEACDLWSCGGIMYVLLRGVSPFLAKDDRELRSKVTKGAVRGMTGPRWETISLEGRQLVKSLLEVRPSERLTAEEALSHEWMARLVPGSLVSASAIVETPTSVVKPCTLLQGRYQVKDISHDDLPAKKTRPKSEQGKWVVPGELTPVHKVQKKSHKVRQAPQDVVTTLVEPCRARQEAEERPRSRQGNWVAPGEDLSAEGGRGAQALRQDAPRSARSAAAAAPPNKDGLRAVGVGSRFDRINISINSSELDMSLRSLMLPGLVEDASARVSDSERLLV
mmetsp:Transcript_52128/g.167754  ORF Transcript_52128/g.167754 Transcript_52128/m.167754 type:complete len:523 (-) Transcript_52128:208-1776(-)